jgi:VanZ family protein
VAAVLLAGAAGWVDEAIQALLPNRVYDLRDVAFNTLAAAAAIAALALRDAARARDRRARA